jgi:protein pelota
MEIIKSDFKKGYVKLKITNPEDLWYLSHLIDPGDLVKGKTTRKVKIGDTDNAKVVKKTYTLKVEAENVEFSEAGDILRINGKVKESPEEIPKDSYHTISLEIGSEFHLEKVQWLEYQRQKLKEAAEKKYNYLICISDREEALFALTKDFGYEVLLKIKGDVQKKAKKVEIKKDFHQEIIKALEVYEGRFNPENIVLASPAFYKDEVYKRIKSEELKQKVVLAICSEVSENALDEVIRRPELKDILKSSRSRTEKIIVDELLSEINKNNLAAYGIQEVIFAVNSGSVSKLIITDECIQQIREEGKFDQIDQLMKAVDSLKGEIHIISSKSESGKKVDGLGGIASILRYKINT